MTTYRSNIYKDFIYNSTVSLTPTVSNSKVVFGNFNSAALSYTGSATRGTVSFDNSNQTIYQDSSYDPTQLEYVDLSDESVLNTYLPNGYLDNQILQLQNTDISTSVNNGTIVVGIANARGRIVRRMASGVLTSERQAIQANILYPFVYVDMSEAELSAIIGSTLTSKANFFATTPTMTGVFTLAGDTDGTWGGNIRYVKANSGALSTDTLSTANTTITEELYGKSGSAIRRWVYVMNTQEITDAIDKGSVTSGRAVVPASGFAETGYGGRNVVYAPPGSNASQRNSTYTLAYRGTTAYVVSNDSLYTFWRVNGGKIYQALNLAGKRNAATNNYLVHLRNVLSKMYYVKSEPTEYDLRWANGLTFHEEFTTQINIPINLGSGLTTTVPLITLYNRNSYFVKTTVAGYETNNWLTGLPSTWSKATIVSPTGDCTENNVLDTIGDTIVLPSTIEQTFSVGGTARSFYTIYNNAYSNLMSQSFDGVYGETGTVTDVNNQSFRANKLYYKDDSNNYIPADDAKASTMTFNGRANSDLRDKFELERVGSYTLPVLSKVPSQSFNSLFSDDSGETSNEGIDGTKGHNMAYIPFGTDSTYSIAYNP